MKTELLSPSPEFESFLAEGFAPATDSLRQALQEVGLAAKEEDGILTMPDRPTLLAPKAIAGALEPPPLAISLRIYRAIGSTNDAVMAWLNEPGDEARVAMAETQLAGKGRRGRGWVSPFGRNIYLTFGRFVKVPLSELGGLSLLLGMQVVEALRSQGLQGLGLKWPNDVLLDGGKLAGILVELKPQEARGIGVVAGIGINLSLSAEDAADIDQAWSAAAMQKPLDRNLLAAALIQQLCAALDRFEAESFAPFQQQWPSYNLYQGKEVAVSCGGKVVKGVDRGVTKRGDLVLETSTGLMEFNAGEVSLRPVATAAASNQAPLS